ncbi:MAG: metallophosphoesterase [Spirochaetaceae bacterium]|jgi:hypothetical protein|nr:metallophosphoesterase [Spirochaetaceae bacterium]
MRLAIGDIHGRDFWKPYLEEDFSECYFVGDYFDSGYLFFIREYANFKEICERARADRRIKLCLGNHDYHYLGGVSERYSRYQAGYSHKIRAVLEENMDLLEVVYGTADQYLISHAGVSTWFMERMQQAGYAAVEDINRAFAQDPKAFGFNGANPFGDDITQGPLWIRPRSLEQQPLAGYHQIVGHTPAPEIKTTDLKAKARITYIDTHGGNTVYWF